MSGDHRLFSRSSSVVSPRETLVEARAIGVPNRSNSHCMRLPAERDRIQMEPAGSLPRRNEAKSEYPSDLFRKTQETRRCWLSRRIIAQKTELGLSAFRVRQDGLLSADVSGRTQQGEEIERLRKVVEDTYLRQVQALHLSGWSQPSGATGTTRRLHRDSTTK